MKCFLCQGELVKGAVRYHIDRKGYHVVFDTIPALMCSQCGEPFFEEKEIDEIQSTIRVLDDHASRVMAVK